ncbi:MAG: winged helix DNA-binding domain-containing protein [Clostridia bacterium]|nr:winged helix DNA-binding domain-containing protein [Clostridia bacterium]
MEREELLLHRLQGQHLLSPGDDPARDLCGMQAQFLRNAVHALRIRTDALSTEGLVKTWTLRGTVHLIPEKDLPLYIRTCGTAEDVCQSGWYQWTAGRGWANPPEREAELARMTVAAIASGVDTREGLREHLRACGMTDSEEARAFNPWGGLIAELANIGVLAFRVDMLDAARPDETKRYRLLAPFTPVAEDAARLELLRRYFAHYGPATLRDAANFFRWTQGEIKSLLAKLPVYSANFAGRPYFWLGDAQPLADMPQAILLAGFDPLLLGYRKEDNPFLPPEHLRGSSTWRVSSTRQFCCAGGSSANGRKRLEGLISPPLSPSVRRTSAALMRKRRGGSMSKRWYGHNKSRGRLPPGFL